MSKEEGFTFYHLLFKKDVAFLRSFVISRMKHVQFLSFSPFSHQAFPWNVIIWGSFQILNICFPSLNLLFKMEFAGSFSWSLTGLRPSTVYWWLRALSSALGLLPRLIQDCCKRRPLCTFLWYRFCSISSKLYFTSFWQSFTNAKDTTSFMAHRL